MFWGCPQEAWFLLKTKQISSEGRNSVFGLVPSRVRLSAAEGAAPVLGWRGDGSDAGLGAFMSWLHVGAAVE